MRYSPRFRTPFLGDGKSAARFFLEKTETQYENAGLLTSAAFGLQVRVRRAMKPPGRME
jgi:hypothetical protein